MVEEALRDPISVKMLKIDGNSIMETFHVEPGPRLGWILNALLEDVLTDSNNNTIEFLNKRTKELLDLPDEQLIKLGESGKKLKEAEENKEIQRILQDNHVS